MQNNQINSIIRLAVFFLFAACVNWILEPLVWLFVKIPFHESGHAVAAWLGGRWALPVFVAGMTFIGQQRSVFFISLSLFSYVCLFYWFYSRKMFFSVCWISLLLMIFVKMTFRTTEIHLEKYIALAGIFGEIVFPTLGLALYFFNIKEIPRWDFWKNPVAVYCSIGFYNSAWQWLRIKSKAIPLPMGSTLSADGAADTSGDLNRLLATGWTEVQITQFYLNALKLCIVTLVVCCVISLLMDNQDEDVKGAR